MVSNVAVGFGLSHLEPEEEQPPILECSEDGVDARSHTGRCGRACSSTQRCELLVSPALIGVGSSGHGDRCAPCYVQRCNAASRVIY